MRKPYNPTMSGSNTISHWQELSPEPVPVSQRREHVRYCSPFAAGLLDRFPHWEQGLDEHQAPRQAALDGEIRELGLDAGLRRFRNLRMLRIIWRDLCGLAVLDETFADLTALAELCLSAALQHHHQSLLDKFGTPLDADGAPQGLAVIGLGKLGGGELNLSSDIDIIFCFRSTGECSAGGRRGLSSEEFFIRLARAVINSLAEVTADGFCFRVDTRLRPFGDSGPLCSSLAALDQYYQREGRDWERYALIKARPVAGDLLLGSELLRQVHPFIYRRYIDFTAIEALQDMHAAVIEDARRRDRLDDIKRGPGGIREIEFLAQCFQLLRGGREPVLQTPSLVQALSGIAELGLLNAATLADIRADYVYLRRLENRIQAQRDQQTHSIPTGDDLQCLARACGVGDVSTLADQVAAVRQRVTQRFHEMFPSQAAPTAEPKWVEVWRRVQTDRQASATSGMRDDDQPLAAFLRSLDRLALSQRARRRLDQFMPVLLHRLDRLSLENRTLHRVYDLVLAICQRSPYLVLLMQHGAALDRMVELFARSEWIATSVIRFPALLDELIDPSLGNQIPAGTDLLQSVARLLRAGQETESVLAGLNYFKLATSLRIAVAQLAGTIDSPEVQAGLSSLAAAALHGVLELATREIEARHGRMQQNEETTTGSPYIQSNASGHAPGHFPGNVPGHSSGNTLAIIAYGSLGASEPGYDSDLDLVFLFSSPQSMSSGTPAGKGRLPAERYYARLAQRVLSLLTAMTPSGRLYPVDTRLRPNGRAGSLVSSLDAFAEYQLNQAWTWELQALTRARFIAGASSTAERFGRIRRKALLRPRLEAELCVQLADMRHRMMVELAGAEGAAGPKHQAGGLVDIEWVVQLGVLANASDSLPLVQETSISGQLRVLVEIGWLAAADAQTLHVTAQALHRQRIFQTLVPGEQHSAVDTRASAGIFARLLRRNLRTAPVPQD